MFPRARVQGEMRMGLRFRQSFQLFPGVRLNLSNSGVSASFGVPAAAFNIGRRGASSTLGVPGTGISFRQYHGGGQPRGGSGSAFEAAEPGPEPAPPPIYYQPLPEMREINSATVEQLTSASLVEL